MQGCNVEAPLNRKSRQAEGRRVYTLRPFSMPERSDQLSLPCLKIPPSQSAPMEAAELRARLSHNGLVLDSYLTVYRDGRLIKLEAPWLLPKKNAPGKRGEVAGFSHNSKRRLFQLLATIKRSAALPAFVTLTYPKQFPSPKVAKQHLDSLFKRWQRRNPKLSAIWKLEPQQRDAPHFHLLVWGGWIDRKQLSQDWFEIVESGDEKHRYSGTKTESVRGWNGVMFYAAKYLGKAVECKAWGRMWGVHNRPSLPRAKPTRRKITREQARFVLVWIQRQLRKPTEWPVTTIMVNSPEQLEIALRL